MSSNRNKRKPAGSARWVVVGSLLVAAFFGSFAYAQASRGTASASTQQVAVDAYGQPISNNQGAGDTVVPSQGTAGTGAGAVGGGCCGGAGVSGAVTKGSATVAGGVQKVTVDLTQGSYTPNQISAKASVPIEITFKGPASGCNGYVQSQDLGFQQDVSNGGTIKVGPLKPGTYSWACSMNMYRASIVVK